MARPPAEPEPIVLDVNLSRRIDRQDLADAGGTQRYRIVQVLGSGAEHRLRPAHGEFKVGSPVTIEFEAPRLVGLRVSKGAGADGAVAVIEPLVELANGRTTPFTLPAVKRIRFNVAQRGKRASVELADLEGELAAIVAWISAPIVKPLAEVGQAKIRGLALQREIAELSALVQGIEAELAVADEMLDFAETLDSDCQLEIVAAP